MYYYRYKKIEEIAETLKMNLGQLNRNNAITDLKNEADGIVRNADGTLSRDYENKSFNKK